MYREPTVFRPPSPWTSFTSRISTDFTQRSSVRPVGAGSSSPHQSGAPAFMVTTGVETIRSGSPSVHFEASPSRRGGGKSAGFPSGAPLSTHLEILAISRSLRELSFLYFWIPMSFSTYQGGMTPGLSRKAVRNLMDFAQGRTSWYVMSDMGATESG